MIRLFLPFSIVAAVLFLFGGGCDITNTAANQEAFERDALQKVPSGFTEITADGTVISEDPDDWRTAPLYAVGRFEIGQLPFPNPYAERSGLAFSGFAEGVGELVLRRLQSNGVLVGLDRDVLGSGTRGFSFVDDGTWFGNVQPGLHRLVVLDGRGRIVTYGDIQVE